MDLIIINIIIWAHYNSFYDPHWVDINNNKVFKIPV